jgi:flagellar protein FlbT
MRISLRAGEKIYLNGAVIRADRKVSLELLNDVAFLLENHIMQPEDTTTPLRQLYFVIQTILMDPKDGSNAHVMLMQMLPRMQDVYGDSVFVEGFEKIREHIARNRPFEALKIIRGLYPAEKVFMESTDTTGALESKKERTAAA